MSGLPAHAHLVVDAMNVLGSRPDGWWRDRDGALRRLVDQLAPFAAARSGAVTVVADGRPPASLPPGRHGPLQLLYAERGGPDAADDRIVSLLAELDDQARRQVTVVTADRGLRARLAELDVGAVGPRQLLALL